MKRRCPKCSAEWDIKGPISFREECPECAAYLHTCGNCRLFDAKANQCRSPTTEPVGDRYENNFCEEYEFLHGEAGLSAAKPPARGPSAKGAANGSTANGIVSRGSNGKTISADEARRRFENLFKDPPK